MRRPLTLAARVNPATWNHLDVGSVPLTAIF
jgi:hypothetical protein